MDRQLLYGQNLHVVQNSSAGHSKASSGPDVARGRTLPTPALASWQELEAVKTKSIKEKLYTITVNLYDSGHNNPTTSYKTEMSNNVQCNIHNKNSCSLINNH